MDKYNVNANKPMTGYLLYDKGDDYLFIDANKNEFHVRDFSIGEITEGDIKPFETMTQAITFRKNMPYYDCGMTDELVGYYDATEDYDIYLVNISINIQKINNEHNELRHMLKLGSVYLKDNNVDVKFKSLLNSIGYFDKLELGENMLFELSYNGSGRFIGGTILEINEDDGGIWIITNTRNFRFDNVIVGKCVSCSEENEVKFHKELQSYFCKKCKVKEQIKNNIM